MPKAIDLDRVAEIVQGPDGSVKAAIAELGLEAEGVNADDARAALQRKFIDYLKDVKNAEAVGAFFDKHGEEKPLPVSDAVRSAELSSAAETAEREFFPLTDDTFDRWVADKTVLIDFTAHWCGPCKVMAPVLRDVAKGLGIPVGRIDGDVSKGSVRRFGVNGYPTVLLLQDGEEKNRVVGAHPDPAELAKILTEAFEGWAVKPR